MMAMNCSILATAPVISKMKVLGVGVDHLGAKGLGEAQRLDAVVAGSRDLDQRQLARQRLVLSEFPGPHRKIDDPMNRHDAFELMLDLLQHMRRTARHHGDARQVLLVLGLGDGEALDVVAAAGKQADDAGKHARLVVDQNRQRMGFGSLGFTGDEIG